MTNEETIKTLSESYYFDAEIALAIKALEKQIPQTVENKMIQGGNIIAFCPTCGNYIEFHPLWIACPFCATKLDWSE